MHDCEVLNSNFGEGVSNLTMLTLSIDLRFTGQKNLHSFESVLLNYIICLKVDMD